jgi:hypothetical protein
MTYSCTDFTDSIIEALGVEVPAESHDDPAEQARLCLDQIKLLHGIAIAGRAFVSDLAALRKATKPEPTITNSIWPGSRSTRSAERATRTT